MKLRLLLLALLVSIAAWAGPQGKLNDAEAHYNRGIDLRDSGDREGSIAEYREAIRLKPDYAVAHNNVGMALEKKGDLNGANTEYHEEPRLDQKTARDHLKRGDALKRKEDYGGAIAQYREAVRLDPKNDGAHVSLADALEGKEDYDGAIAEYREALRLNPKNDKVQEYLQTALYRKDLRAALREAEKFEKEDKNFSLIPKDQTPRSDHKSSNNLRIILYSLVGFGAGLYFFIKGFLVFRELRVVEDTPEVPIRSIAMGLTHIHGNSEGEQTVPGPVSKWPCYFYEVCIERWETDSKGGGHWSECATDADGVKFYLADATGKVLVDAHGAECELLQSGLSEIGSGGSPHLGFNDSTSSDLSFLKLNDSPASIDTDPVSDNGLRAYLEKAAPGSSTGRYRLTEVTILPNRSYDVIGTCVENPQARDEHDRNLIVKGQNEQTFIISWKAEKEVEQTLRKRAALYVFGGAGLAIVCLAVFLVMIKWI